MKIINLLLLTLSLMEANTITIKLPKVPEVPKVNVVVPQTNIAGTSKYPTNEEILREATQKKVIIFSNHVAPVIFEKKDEPNSIIQVGDISNGRVSAYLHAPLQTTNDVLAKLKAAGFKVLKTFKVDKKGFATSITFTNERLIKLASKKGRGFASVLRVTIDKKNELISISNPIFVLKAFMQEEYDKNIAHEILNSLRLAFKDLKNSQEILKARLLERYQFMQGMPKYQDMQIIAQDSSAKLLEKAKKSKNVVYMQTLLNGVTLLGVKLNRRTAKFIKKIGYQNAALLPYPVIIENGKAKILDPKYYIAIMYPMLKMSQFMTIATVPGAINKDIDRVFR